MATVTTGGSGNWSSTTPNAPWPGGTLPVAGDDVVVAAGHTLTVDGNYTIGSSPDNLTTWAVSVSAGTGGLTINTGCTLTVKGNVRFVGGSGQRLTINGTGKLLFDTTARTSSPKTHELRASSGEFTLYMRGTSAAAPACIEADSGGYWAMERTAGGTRLGLLDIEFGRWHRAWDGVSGASARAWRCNAGAITGVAAHINHLVMDTCGPIIMAAGGASVTADVEKVFFENGASGSTAYYGIVWSAFTGSATMTKCVFEAGPNSDGNQSVVATECVWNTLAIGGSVGYGPGTENNVIIRKPPDDGSLVGSITTATQGPKNCLMWNYSTDPNPHWTFFGGSSATRVADGAVIAGSMNGTGGDIWNGGGGTAAFTIRNTVTLLGADGKSIGVMWAPLAAAGTSTFAWDHNSVAINEYGIYHFGENPGSPGHTGMLTVATNNHWYLAPGDTPLEAAIIKVTDGTVANRAVASGIDYNMIEAGVAYNTNTLCYSDTNQATPTAANDDYNVSSSMIEVTRNQTDWAGWWGARIGASGNANSDATDANAENLLTYYYRDNMGSAPMIATMLQYLRRGWIPTAAAVRNGGSDGQTRSAYGMWAPSVTTPTVTGSTASCTTNAADGTVYWVITQSTNKPDWDRIIAGQDHTGAAVASGFSGSQAVSSTSIAINISGAALGGGNYYIHVAHSADATTNGDAAQAAYLRTSETVTSAAFQAAAGGGARNGGAVVSHIRSPIRSPITSSIRGGIRAAA